MIALKNTRTIIIGFAIIAVIFFMYSDSIVAYTSTLNPVLALLAIAFLNPIYIIFIYTLYQMYGWRGAIGGFLISTASDLISLPHILEKTGEVSKASYNLFPETTFWQLFPDSLKMPVDLPFFGSVNLGTLLIYIVVSTGLIVLALIITHKKKFKEIFQRSM